MKRLLVAAAALLLPFTLSAQRLPRIVIPTHYDLAFTPHLSEETFDGSERIRISVQQPTTEIVLNALEIEFRRATIETEGRDSQTATVRLDPQAETAILTVARPLQPGPAVLRIEYLGKLNHQLRGFYIGSAPSGKYAASQGEATDIRRAFPAFDEPEMKATFSISLITDKSLTPISNGPVESDTPGPGPDQHTVRFATTPRLSTYLVALEVGDFRCLSGEAAGVPLRVCALGDRSTLGGFALESAKNTMTWFDRYYAAKYPFPKLDHIAIPDFRAGAMENAGAIVYRETALLADDKTSSLATRKSIASVIAHETAHMWFGDLVTMRWWNDIWLNEGFATWMETKPLEQWQPAWGFDLDDVAETGTAMNVDVLSTTRAIRSNAERSSQIGALFDAIAYQKTASILRMIESTIGEEKFRTGVNAYIAGHAFGNAQSFDFSDALASASTSAAADVMNSYVNQRGLPLVSVLSSRCSGGMTEIQLNQNLFRGNGHTPEAGYTPQWVIPICPAGLGEGEQCQLLRGFQDTLRFRGCSDSSSAQPFLNRDGRGYFVSHYQSPDGLKQVIQRADQLRQSEKMVLVRDQWLLMRAGMASLATWLDLAAAFRNDATPQLLTEIHTGLEYISRNLTTAADRADFQKRVRVLLQPLAQSLGTKGVPGESENRRVARGQVLKALAITGGDPQAKTTVRRLAEQYLRDRKSLDPDMAADVVEAAAAGGDVRLYDQIVNAYRAGGTPEEHRRFLLALADFRDPSLLSRTMTFALTDDVRSQDTSPLLSAVLRNPAGGQVGLPFLEQHWSEITTKFPDRLRSQLTGATSSFCDDGSRDEVQRFFASHPVPGAERGLAQALERITICNERRTLQQQELADWLSKAGAGAK
jgi:aminopeptidase N